MNSHYELFDLASGNVIEDYAGESEAIDALIQVVAEHGPQAMRTFALTFVDAGSPVLIVMEDDLVMRVEREVQRLAPHRRSS